MVLMVGTGFAMSSTMAQANTIVQTNSPDRLRGRVMSIYLTVFAGSTPIGAALAGFTSAVWGAPGGGRHRRRRRGRDALFSSAAASLPVERASGRACARVAK